MTDILDTMRAEIDEAINLMRPHFPNSNKDALRIRAENWRQWRYQKSHWPDFAVVAKLEQQGLSLKQQQDTLEATAGQQKQAA